MQSDQFISQSPWWRFWQTRLAPGLVLVYQLIALACFILVPVLANGWLRLPFIGAFVENSLVVNTAVPSQPGSWQLQKQNLEFGSQIASLNDVPIQDVHQLYALLGELSVGDSARIGVRTPGGESQTYSITLQSLPTADRLTYLIIPYLIGLIYFASSLWVFGLRREQRSAQNFSLLSSAIAIGLIGLFDVYTTNRLTVLWTASLALAGGAMVGLALRFPQEDRLVQRRPFLSWIGYLPSIILFGYAATTLFRLDRPLAYITAWQLEYSYLGFSVLFFCGWVSYRYFSTRLPVVREQARLILLGSIIAFGPLCAWFIVKIFLPEISFWPYLLIFVAVFPAATAYAIIRYRMLNTDLLLNRTIVYGLLTILTAAGYALMVSGISLLAGDRIRIDNPYLIGIYVFLLAFLINPVRAGLQKLIDKAFGREQAFYQEGLQLFSRQLTEALELEVIIALLRRIIQESLNPESLHVYVRDPLSDQYVATPDETGQNSSDLHFTTESQLVSLLANQGKVMFLPDDNALPGDLYLEKSRLALLGSQLFVPLPGRQQLTGWIALGPRRSGEPYSSRAVDFLEALCDQAALAVERAQVVRDLERRIHEMNVLTRVSQGINVTLVFDDILELVYAQANQVIHTRDFMITLFDSRTDVLYHVFYLQDDERLTEKEGQSLPYGQGLERDLISARRPFLTDDYPRECRNRGMLPAMQDVFAWMGVPLNTGAETIGVISAGSRDPSVMYSLEQMNILQAIADQAAGAIVKAQLLQEAERRARQLTTLNEVARSMTSTLELQPLLNQILQSAVEILNCEAGSLLLVDDQTGDLVFEVAVGPVASDLLGRRLPSGTGLVGKAVDTRQAVIVNDVRRSKEWFDKPDEQTGFVTNDLLVVPMQFKDEIMGVIEVINRRDGLPFTNDDLELLSAFTSQAAVALENARLYTLTDQTLAARVEELSVMQRIDRELNASLDISRAMRITLEWAMRQSKADAGLVGIVVENSGIQVMASQGYSDELTTYQDALLPANLPALDTALVSGETQIFLASENGREANPAAASAPHGILKNAERQIVVPIRQEDTAIGVLILESLKTEAFPEELLSFLSRLTDHAAIAIANAKLYTEVEAANIAKSDFVSLVSHELKTPMTSIRGFTDLLAAGMVGPVNEAQSNFLTTIRTNVDRMATLVSDLTDISRIEAGRMRLEFESIGVQEIIDEVVRSTHAQIDEKQQTLNLDIRQDLPNMWGDRSRIIQVLANLVSNAYKYTPQNGQITISAALAQNTWDLEGSPQVIHLAVEDNGYGISEENQQKIFQKFFRSDDQKVRDAPGTGLGLSITRTLVEMQGGRIWFESTFREGSTFHFTIPITEMTEA